MEFEEGAIAKGPIPGKVHPEVSFETEGKRRKQLLWMRNCLALARVGHSLSAKQENDTDTMSPEMEG